MADSNVSGITEFILLGLTDNPELNTVLFVLFLLICLITVLGNVWIIAIILVSDQLHSPKYLSLASWLSWISASPQSSFLSCW